MSELREVRGPSALGGGWRRSADLLYLIAATEFKRTYFGTALGYAWSVARPLMLFGVLLAVFTQAFHLPRSLYLADAAGIDAMGLACDARAYANATRDALREHVASVRALVDVELLGRAS